MSSNSYKREKMAIYAAEKKSKSVPSDNECNDEANNGGMNRTNVESKVRIKFRQRELNINGQSLSSQDLETPSDINFDLNSIISDCDIISDHGTIVPTDSPIVNQPSMLIRIEQKIHDWVLRNRTNITLIDLLNILRSLGYMSLPRTAETLLGTKIIAL